MFNPTPHVIKIKKHERVAQAVLKEVPKANFIVVNKLEVSERNEGGFGSTGTTEIKKTESPNKLPSMEEVREERQEMEEIKEVVEESDEIAEVTEEIPETTPTTEEPKVHNIVNVYNNEGETQGVVEVDTETPLESEEIQKELEKLPEELEKEPETAVEDTQEETETNVVKLSSEDSDYETYSPMIDQAIDAIINKDEEHANMVDKALDIVGIEDIKTKAILKIVENKLSNTKTVLTTEVIAILKDILND